MIYWDDYTNPDTVPNHIILQIAPETAGGAPFRNNCSSGCVFNTEITNLLDGPNFVNVTGLTSGTLYTIHYEFTNLCVNKEEYYLSSCRMTPNPLNLTGVGNTGTLTPQINYVGGQVIGIHYSSTSESIATVSNVPYQSTPNQTHTTTVTGVAVGQISVTNDVYFHDTTNDTWPNVCQGLATVNVGPVSTPTITPTITITPTPSTPPLICSLIGSTIRWSWSGAQAWLQVSGSPWLFNDWSTSPVDTSGGTPGNTYTGTATFTGGNPWSTPVSCTVPTITPTSVPTVTLTPTPTRTPTPTPTTAPGPWIKLKNSSFYSRNNLR